MLQWYVLFAKPRKEAFLEGALRGRGFEVYLPMLRPRWSSRDQTPRPLFPRYLFIHLDMAETLPDEIKWTPGLANFVTFGGVYAGVPDILVSHVRTRLNQLQAANAPGPVFQQGQPVQLPQGHPLAELDPIFDKPMSDGKRAVVLVQLLGRLVRAEVPLDALEARS